MKTAIYLRTSTEEQHPENQLADCNIIAERLGDKDCKVFEEQKSAWKDDYKRDVFNEVRQLIKKREIKSLIVWDLDRLYRNRKKLIAFFKFCRTYNCKVYSFRQTFLEDIHSSPEPWNEMLFDNMIFILGWISEEESTKRSERVRLSMKKNKHGQTISKYGKVWGRKKMGEKAKRKIIEMHNQGKTYREICNGVTYWDKNRHKRNVSMGVVHKILAENKRQKFDIGSSS